MSRISRSHLHQKALAEITEHFSYLISSLTKADEIENFFIEFLTKEEKIMLAKRLVLFMMLKRNYPPSTIQSALHISYETVRTYQNHLSAKSTIFQQTIDRLIRREKTNEFFKKIDKFLKPLELALEAKSNIRSRAKLLSGDWE